MRHVLWLVLALAACTSAEEAKRQRELAMIAQATADSVAEAEFVVDSIALAASITVDTIADVRIRSVAVPSDDGDDGGDGPTLRHEAVAPGGKVCAVTPTRYVTLIRGDTLSCQWGAPE